MGKVEKGVCRTGKRDVRKRRKGILRYVIRWKRVYEEGGRGVCIGGEPSVRKEGEPSVGEQSVLERG